uniref:SPARC related modular calcium binding 1 n=1 Tax=Latimeria chalumnae TaxID=7897 RepID=H3BHA0_LATCH
MFHVLASAFRFDRSPFLISENDRLHCYFDCPRERHKPVCGSDGKLYKSHCIFQRAKCRDSGLEALPRAHCNEKSLSRCQDDRAHALAQAKRQVDSIYIPECNEDGSFLQVQCHKQTGYCWCSTPEGKPVSGTSVLNQTPNCTGTCHSVLLTSPFSFNNRGKKSDSRSKTPLLSSFPVFRRDEMTAPPFWITILFNKESKVNRTIKRTPESPPSCEHERRDAIDEAQLHQHEGTFIPECEADGRYKIVQCHQATGYCWCVRIETGRPIPGTSTRNFLPDCTTDMGLQNTELGTLFRDRALPGCPGAKKTEFLSNLLKALASDMMQSRAVPFAFRRTKGGQLRSPDGSPGPTLEERAVRWHFVRLDKDFSNNINEREIRPLKVYMKKNARPKRCVRKFVDYCDLNSDRVISLQELKGCLGLRNEGREK